MRRLSLTLALGLALALPALAAVKPADKPAADAVAAIAAAKSQFLDKSYVTLPNKVGDYTLVSAEYDQNAFNVGVSSDWKIAGAPDVKLNLYVYPIGRAGEEEVVTGQIADVEAAVREATKEGYYTDLVVGEKVPFVVVRREAEIVLDEQKRKKQVPAFDPTPKPETELKPSDKADPILAALAEATPSPNNHGYRQSFSFKKDGIAVRSLGYVFYRHLFGFKVRISAPESTIDGPAFEAMADAAARTLVPSADVESFGECGTITITPHGKDDKGGGAELMRGMMRIQYENCANNVGDTGEPVPPDSTRNTIVYPPGTWKHD
jgi:hypothetical protein